MSHAKNKVEWCLKKAEKELQEKCKHRGLVQVGPNTKKAEEHIIKAEHNLIVTLHLKQAGFTDWCSSTLFYTIYHCFLAILSKFGYQSRNQECTFAAIIALIEEEKISLNKEDVKRVSALDEKDTQETTHTMVSIREEYQYNTKLSLENKEYEELLALAKHMLEKTKEIIIQ